MSLLRVTGVIGFVLTLVGAGFLVIYTSLVEGSYEAGVRSEPWEWVLAASYVGGIAGAIAIGGLGACRRAAVHFGAVAQGIAAVVVLALALPNFDSPPSDFERNFIVATSLVLLFDAAVVLISVALQRHRQIA